MSLEFAILGFLDKVSMTGYDLKKQFDNTIRHAWEADQSQIYRVLAKLDENGLVTREVIEQDDRPDRKVYHITPKGRETLTIWLKSLVQIPPMRYGPMVQVFFSGQLSDKELLDLFETHLRMLRSALKRLEEAPIWENIFGDVITSERDSYMASLTVEIRKHDLETRLEYFRELIRRLKSGDFPQNKSDRLQD